MVRRDVEGSSASFVTTGVVLQQFDWHVSQHIRTHDGRRPIAVAFAFASQVFHIDHVATA